MTDERLTWLKHMWKHAEIGLGKTNHFFILWALAKSGVECGWNPKNDLIVLANNCLGIKAGAKDGSGKWSIFSRDWKEGIDFIWMADSKADGRDDGTVPWRKFDTLGDCFIEFSRMLNDRAMYIYARRQFVETFEMVYTDNLPGHPQMIQDSINDLLALGQDNGVLDHRGRIRKASK